MAILLDSHQVSTGVCRIQFAHFPGKPVDTISILRGTCWRIFQLEYSLECPVWVSDIGFNIHDSCFFFFRPNSPQWARASTFTRFLHHTQRRTTVGSVSLDKRWACRRDLYLTTHNTHNRQTSMPPVRFKPTISADERPQTYALDHVATGTGITAIRVIKNEILIYWSRPETLEQIQLKYNQLQFS